MTTNMSSRTHVRDLLIHHPARPDSTIQNSTLRIHNFLQCLSVHSVVIVYLQSAKIRVLSKAKSRFIGTVTFFEQTNPF
jgi:hypothetical protein